MKSNDYSLISGDFIRIRNTKRKPEVLLSFCHPDMNHFYQGKKFLGSEKVFFDKTNYDVKFKDASDAAKYTFLLSDGSMIMMQYLFDAKGLLLEHSLTYAPDPSLIFDKHFTRIDYSSNNNDFKDVIHSKCHAHFSISDSSPRITVNHYLMPSDFLFLILKYYYLDDSEFTNSLVINKNRIQTLSSKESKLVFINFV